MTATIVGPSDEGDPLCALSEDDARQANAASALTVTGGLRIQLIGVSIVPVSVG